MSSINKAIIVGRLGHDPELRTLPSGGAVCELSVATDHRKKEGEETEVTWHKVIVYGKPGETLGKIATKGAQVYIEGRMHHRAYEVRDEKRVAFEIVAERAMLLGSKPQAQAASEASASDYRKAKEGAPGSATEAVRAAAKRNIKQTSFDEIDDDIPF